MNFSYIGADTRFHYLRRVKDQFKCRSDDCKEAIQAANNRKESRDVAALLLYEPIYWHMILHRTVEFVRLSITPLRIEG